MFYVYCRNFYPVWEPAEGGYYVCCSEITGCVKCYSLEDAYEELLESVVEAEECGYTIDSGSWSCGFVNHDAENPYTTLELPWFLYDQHGYVGDGFEIGISLEEPRHEPYTGYC